MFQAEIEVVTKGRGTYELTKRVADAVRPYVSLARHDLLTEPPPVGAPFELVVCRNVLIYLRPELQPPVLDTLIAALRPGGLLFLGEAEWPAPSVAPRLAVVHRGARLFRRL